MTRRERLLPPTTSQGSGRPAPSAAPPRWEEFFQAASPVRQQELLALARRQGLLYAHQLTTAGNGAPDPQPLRRWLDDLLAGRLESLPPVGFGDPPAFADTALDSSQREAVARALRTPDLCLIQGFPGTGKSRVTAEIIKQSVNRGERVLLLAYSGATLDRVLSLVADRDDICAVRCLAADETPESLPASSQGLTFSERLARLREQPLARARQDLEGARRRQARREQDGPVFDRLHDLATRHEALAGQLQALEERIDRTPADVAALAEQTVDEAANPLSAAIARLAVARREALEGIDRALGELEAKVQASRREREPLAAQLQQLRALARAKQEGRWWTGAWWRATCRRGLAAKLIELERRWQQAEEALAQLHQEADQLRERRRQSEQAFSDERAGLIAAEVQRRQAESQAAAASIRREQAALEAEWQSALQPLAEDTHAPQALTTQAVAAARHAFRQQCQEDAERCRFAADWVTFLEQEAAHLGERLPGYANLVAATTTALAADPHFGDGSPVTFDLVILREADQVAPSEFLSLMRRARRWVLVGEAPWENPGESLEVASTAHRPARTPAALPRPALRPDFFERLWQRLHPDPRTLPYRWGYEGERLCCRLRPVAPERRHWLESERVADAPDIELRILTVPGARPVLAEVLFPGETPVGRAKQFLFRELEEAAVEPAGYRPGWEEMPGRLVFRLADGDGPDGEAVELEPGVREILDGVGHPGNGQAPGHGRTSRIEFERAAGWDRARAEQWVARHLGLRDRGRTARLDVPHRMHPGLAAFLSDLLFAGAYRLRPASALAAPGDTARACRCPEQGTTSPVEFLAVPPLTADAPARRTNGHAAPARPPRPAGLELDLADRIHRDRLPAELRPLLPAAGLVNYLEAQAVVRTLEAMAHDRPGGDAPRNPVAVLALYPAQVELIRRLVRQSPRLAAAGLDVSVDVPSAFRGRESAVTLLSLTRSHAHRPVSFGEGPQDLALALTRARSRLILLGDPGTLARRCQWDGPVEHLDADSAARERALIGRLLRYVQGQGPHQQAFHLCEAAGP